MAYLATNYDNNPNAPIGKWTCSPGSKLGPYASAPTGETSKHPDYCGQCVSFVRTVCSTMPPTGSWKRGAPVKDNKNVVPGTAIATFTPEGKYLGHAAIFVSQVDGKDGGLNVYDQWVTPPNPKAVGPRFLSWGARGNANNGDNYYVVE